MPEEATYYDAGGVRITPEILASEHGVFRRADVRAMRIEQRAGVISSYRPNYFGRIVSWTYAALGLCVVVFFSYLPGPFFQKWFWVIIAAAFFFYSASKLDSVLQARFPQHLKTDAIVLETTSGDRLFWQAQEYGSRRSAVFQEITAAITKALASTPPNI